jgi:N-acyl amino acid synthase of PEP-CTERM/exosortase system
MGEIGRQTARQGQERAVGDGAATPRRVKAMNQKSTVYEIILADTEEGRAIHFKLRYQIYCIENNYEDANAFLDGMERDEHDAHAVHFLILHKPSKQWVGAFRLILNHLHTLPTHQYVKIAILHTPKSHGKAAEFSRLAVTRTFQKLPGKIPKDIDNGYLVFKAICVGIDYARKHGANIIIFLGRRSLAHIIGKMGIKVWPIGTKILYRGERYPYKFDLARFPHSVFQTPKDIHAFQANNGFKLYSQVTSGVTQNIAEIIGHYFQMVEANTPGTREAAYRLRHHAYGLAMPFTPPAADTMGMDEYDRRSEYALIQHKQTGHYAATTRLILPDGDNPGQPFPIEKYCQIERTDRVESVPRFHLAEVSRFCVAEDFKRRSGEQGSVSGVATQSARTAPDDGCRRHFPYITLVLIGCLLRTSTHHGITHWYALMEPALIVLFKQMGISLAPVGPPIQYHGLCVPCVIEVQSLLAESGPFSQFCQRMFANRAAH